MLAWRIWGCGSNHESLPLGRLKFKLWQFPLRAKHTKSVDTSQNAVAVKIKLCALVQKRIRESQAAVLRAKAVVSWCNLPRSEGVNEPMIIKSKEDWPSDHLSIPSLLRDKTRIPHIGHNTIDQNNHCSKTALAASSTPLLVESTRECAGDNQVEAEAMQAKLPTSQSMGRPHQNRRINGKPLFDSLCSGDFCSVCASPDGSVRVDRLSYSSTADMSGANHGTGLLNAGKRMLILESLVPLASSGFCPYDQHKPLNAICPRAIHEMKLVVKQ